MAKNDLHLTIPPHFRCPISLELMHSPVALSTGITYDRSSIQPWLDAGNLTCPATMLPLPNSHFIPNLSLLNLIHLHLSFSLPNHNNLSLLLLRFSSSASTNPPPFADLSTHLSALLDLAKHSEDHRSALADSDPFFSSILRLTNGSSEIEIQFLELAVVTLELVSRESEKCKNKIRDLVCLDPIAIVLRSGNAASRIAAAKLVDSLSIAAGNQELVADLYGLVDSEDNNSIEAGLAALISISTNRASKLELIRLGTVKTLGKIISRSNASIAVCEKAMEMAELLARSAIGREAICEEEKCLGAIVRKVMKVSEKATEFGITVVWSLCYRFRNEKAVGVVAGSNGLTKCLVVMQSNCSAIVRKMCRDVVKVLGADSVRLGMMSYDTNTTHIMPC